MSKIHRIKRRIKSVAKVGQITKAMEHVAASKMRRAQQATLRSRMYAASAWEILGRLYQLTSPKSHALFARRAVNNRLLILITSDRGLAGAYNSNLSKIFLEEVRRDARPPQVIVVGRKGAEFVSRLGTTVTVMGVYTDWPAEPTVTDVQPIVTTALKNFAEGTVDAVRLIYTDFVSMARQQAVNRELLPLTTNRGLVGKDVQEATFEPSPKVVLEYVVPRVLEVQVFQAVLEAVASEHSMRMLAMQNASNNALDLRDDLTLMFNRARQSVITQELAEITAGAEAVV